MFKGNAYMRTDDLLVAMPEYRKLYNDGMATGYVVRQIEELGEFQFANAALQP
ncbi:hypothetical protein SPFM12_00279 [Salmonella phage SPFM12]|nr:hypothetical protein SPFM12_00279 [Salmonella phage SPFM12]